MRAARSVVLCTLSTGIAYAQTPAPTRAPGATNWWYFPNSDCNTGSDPIGGCSTATTVDECKTQCLANPECGGFNWPHKHFKTPDCFYHDGSYPGLDVYALHDSPQPAPTPAPTGDTLESYVVDNQADAVCSNGNPATGYIFKGEDSTGWVLQLGNAPTLDFCISETACEFFGTKGTPPPTPPPAPPPAQYYGGVWSPNCTINPSFCKFSQASIPALCDAAMGLGTKDQTFNGTLVRFRGQKVLDAAIKKLATLGLDKAEKVLIVGIGHGGTAAIFLADIIQEKLKAIAPGLKVYKVMPADGIHPNYISMLDIAPFPGSHFEWFQTALQFQMNVTGADAVLPSGCLKANAGKEWRCLYANETLPYIKSDIFAVQQLASVWDMQCLADGSVIGNILQVDCSNHGGNYFKDQYVCTQYPDLCAKYIVQNYTVPFQQTYLDDMTRIGFDKKPGSGGFFHSCYLGNYIPATLNATGQWNLIGIKGTTMQEAVTKWWEDAAGTEIHWYPDTVWDPNGMPPAGQDYETPPDAFLKTADELGAPVAPAWTCRYMTNPTCKNFKVWY